MGEWQRDADVPRLRVEGERGQCTAVRLPNTYICTEATYDI